MMLPDIHLRKIEAQESYGLRQSVLSWTEPKSPDDQLSSRHLALYYGNEAIAVISYLPAALLPIRLPEAVKFYGLAVQPAYQGKRIGSLLLKHVEQLGRQQGKTAVWANGRPEKLGFYQRQGYQVLGGVFFNDNTGFKNQIVYKELAMPRLIVPNEPGGADAPAERKEQVN